MRAINHALTGAAIGVTLGWPPVAVPVAFLSHFMLDPLPHFGIDQQEDIATRWFIYLLIMDFVLCPTLVLILFVNHGQHWLLACICAFVATMPDLTLIPRFYRAKHYGNKSHASSHWFVRFHDRFQREVPLGALTELIWASLMIFTLVRHLA